MYVYSGKCRLCECGQKTPFADVTGNVLFTGDIVITYTDDYGPENLTVVVSDQFQSFSDGTHKEKDDSPEAFVMGIRSVPLDEPGRWRVRRLKSFSDVVEGEHWTAFGFSFKTI